MKHLYFIALFTTFSVFSQTVPIEDLNFKTGLLAHIPVIDLNNDGEIQVSEAQATLEINLPYKNISGISGIEYFTNLTKLVLTGNQLSHDSSNPLDLNIHPSLQHIDLSLMNGVSAINLSQLTLVTTLRVGDYTPTLLVHPSIVLQDLKCSYTSYNALPATAKTQLELLGIFILLGETSTQEIHLGAMNALTSLTITGEPSSPYITALTGTFPLLDKLNFDSITIVNSVPFTPFLTVEEFQFTGNAAFSGIWNQVYSLTNLKRLTLVSHYSFSPEFPGNQLNLSSLPLLEYFKLYLTPSTANYLPPVLSSNTNLKRLELTSYHTSQLNLQNNVQLEVLKLTMLRLENGINLNNNQSLKVLEMDFNSYTEPGYALDLSQNPLLENVRFHEPMLQSLTLGDKEHLVSLQIVQAKLTELDLPSVPVLSAFTIISNAFDIYELDLSKAYSLDSLDVDVYIPEFMAETFINMKNGSNESHVHIARGESVTNICIDEGDPTDTWMFEYFNTLNVRYNTYCNFNPAGPFYTLTGNARLDIGSDGCAVTDVPAGGLKVLIDDGTESGYTFTDADGNYTFYTAAPEVTMSSESNVAYYSATPVSNLVTFTDEAQTVNLCLTPVGVHHDVEVTLLPLTAARPGFDAVYRIVFTNKGNQASSGTVSLSFNDDVTDFVSAAPVQNLSGLGSLSWNFTGLLPFASRHIDFTLNLNSPQEFPAVNISDLLEFNANITAILPEETPDDNVFNYNQVVIGSYDPNDKTVLEGEQIGIADVSNYLTYIIRFQNTGTASAINVVVKDMIAENLDPSTVQVISTSHSYRSTLTEANKLEFFFEGINLPAESDDEPGSHGFVAFKIKPAATVALGSVMENTAEIYFDYNFPIVTNTVSTTVTALARTQFDNYNTSILYPNPAHDILRINTDNIADVQIFNLLGQKVLSLYNVSPNDAIDVSAITSGTYLVRISNSAGTSIEKLLKL
ncbi:MAG TPA: T9SS type A sorting domain-containing protein [Flavobacterium sp.]|jgi:uncharacterized repeat protein (TIGR01451 family)